ncbi:hypothetical protein OEZ86_010466 [Tetradesmus obliquus]|nr:hypothetical protein OEZ86_010466 [Tetradesmus obliquus]
MSSLFPSPQATHTHRLPRQQLQTVSCNHCRTKQPLYCGDTCLTCGTLFAAYFCTECGIANDDVPCEGYFHCGSCGICRVGRRDEFRHCDGCGCCLRRKVMREHACRHNCLEAACPICLSGPLSDSQSPAHKLPCGHMAHYSCIQATDKPLASICTACNGGSSSSSSSRAAAKERFFAGLAAEVAAARNPAPAGGGNSSSSSSSSSSSRVSGYVRDLLDLLQPQSAMGLGEGELLPLLQELEGQQLLPAREVRVRGVLGYRLKDADADFVHQLKPSFLRNVWLSEASTQFVQQAAVAAAAEGLSGRVVTSTIRLVKAWVRKGLQQQQGMGGYKRLRSFQIELLVLHAAERLAAELQGAYGGGVFDQTDAPFELWAEFGRAAQLLQRQLLSCSWGEIMCGSSLSAVVA